MTQPTKRKTPPEQAVLATIEPGVTAHNRQGEAGG